MIDQIEKHPILVICLTTILILFPILAVLDVSIMEARGFITTREMVQDGHWLLPTMNGEARYQKPPLPSWITAISAIIFGLKNNFALRLPAVFFTFIIGLFSYFISFEILKNKSKSLLNSLIVLTSFYVIAIVFEAPWDIFTHSFMLVGIYYLIRLLKAENPKISQALIVGVMLSCSFMSKGPVSLYVLFLPFIIAYAVIYKIPNIKRLIPHFLLIIFLALLLGAWWYVYVRWKDPISFTAISNKEINNWTNYNVKPIYYYWSFFTQSGLWTIPAIVAIIYPYMKTRVANLKAYQFTLLWMICSVLLLSIIPEKKHRYLMPVLIPLGLTIGFYIQYLIEHFKTSKQTSEKVLVYINFGLIGLVGLLIPFITYYFIGLNMDTIPWPFILFSIVNMALGFYMLMALKKGLIKTVFYSTIGLFCSLVISLTSLGSTNNNPNYYPIQALKENPSYGQLPLYYYDYIAPEMVWNYGEKIVNINDKNGTLNIPNLDQFGLIISNEAEQTFTEIARHFEIKNTQIIDLNRFDNSSNQYNKRLSTNVYLLHRK